MKKPCTLVLSGLIAVLALFPMLVAGEASPGAAPGPLTFIGAAFDNGLNGADLVAVSPDGTHVYVAGYEGDAVAVFSRDPVAGLLTFVQVRKDSDAGVDGLDGATSVAVSPDGDHVYVAGYLDGAVAAFSRNDATGESTFVEARKDGDRAYSTWVAPARSPSAPMAGTSTWQLTWTTP